MTTFAGKNGDIGIGDLLCKTNSTNWIWRVAEFITPRGHRPHARLVRVNCPSDSRIFAVAALKDRRLFVEAEDAKGHLTAASHYNGSGRLGFNQVRL